MRGQLTAAAGAALMMGLAIAGPAAAYQTVAGGLAGECSSLARAGVHDDQALDVCSRALSGDALNLHDLAGTYVNRGAMRLLGSANEQARADFSSAIRIDPTLGEAHVGLGGYLISQQRYREAEAEITRGLALDTEQPERAYYFRAVARWGQDDFKGAYFDFKKASELKPDWADPRQQLAYFTVTPVR